MQAEVLAGERVDNVILEKAAFERIVENVATEIVGKAGDLDRLAVIGIRTRGVALAESLIEKIAARTGKPVPFGVLDITLYRDDLAMREKRPVVKSTKIPFDLNDLDVVLVDDVLYTGRTVRAALDEILDFGRPARVRLAVLVDRGLREFPIQPDYVGLRIETTARDKVHVHMRQTDGEDKVILLKNVITD